LNPAALMTDQKRTEGSRWNEVGPTPARVVYGKGSGLPSVQVALEALGIDADDEQMRALVTAIRQRALKTKALSRSRKSPGWPGKSSVKRRRASHSSAQSDVVHTTGAGA
jgi:hypothetical protein